MDNSRARHGRSEGNSGGGGGGRGGLEDAVARIVRDLEAMQPGESVRIGPVSDGLRSSWPDTREKPIHIQHSTRDYYRRSHEWVRDHEDDIVRAILDPDMIRLDARKPEVRSLLYREAADGRTILVVVQQKLGPTPFNRVMTTFDVLPMEVARRDRTESFVWRKGKG